MKRKHMLLSVILLALLAAGCAPRPAASPATPVVTDTHPMVTAPPAETQPEEATAAPAQASGRAEINVFAAASLTEPFGEIGKLFEASHPGVRVNFNFAGSQQLAQQIIEGAPVDVFASANKKQMDAVINPSKIVTGTQKTFAKNRLVLIYPKENPAGVKVLKDLAKSGLKLVIAAKEVPVGQYALDFLEKAKADPAYGATFKDDVLKNVVSYEENVKAVLTKVALGEADAGIVYTSDISGADSGKVFQLAIPDALNVIASYPIAPLRESRHPDLAQAFIDLVLSADGQQILAKFNFIPVK